MRDPILEWNQKADSLERAKRWAWTHRNIKGIHADLEDLERLYSRLVARIDSLDAKLDRLAGRLSVLEGVVSNLEEPLPSARQLCDIEERLDKMNRRIDQLFEESDGHADDLFRTRQELGLPPLEEDENHIIVLNQ